MTIPHSPAPWHYDVSAHCPDVWEIHAEFCESPIAEVPRWQDEDGTDSREAIANAVLMTAAPRLHDTLCFVAEMLGSFAPDVLQRIGLEATFEETLAALRCVARVGEPRP